MANEIMILRIAVVGPISVYCFNKFDELNDTAFQIVVNNVIMAKNKKNKQNRLTKPSENSLN